MKFLAACWYCWNVEDKSRSSYSAYVNLYDCEVRDGLAGTTHYDSVLQASNVVEVPCPERK